MARKKSFNSLQVESKVKDETFKKTDLKPFQFLIGRVKSPRGSYSTYEECRFGFNSLQVESKAHEFRIEIFAHSGFQFLIGRVKRGFIMGYRNFNIMFQFLIGRVKRNYGEYKFYDTVSHVSIPYRQSQKIKFSTFSSNPYMCFNSLQVESKENEGYK